MSFFRGGVLVELCATTVTAGGTTTLTATSSTHQQFTGTTTQTVVLPDATTFASVGYKYVIQNRSTGLITVNRNGGTLVTLVYPGFDRTVQCTDISTAAGVWDTSTGSGLGGLPTVTGSTGSPTAIVAGTGITFSGGSPRNWQLITGSGGAVVVSANPQVQAGTIIGQELYLIGQSNTNTVSLADGNGLSLTGPIEIGLNTILGLLWDGTTWIEFFRRL